MLKLRIWIGLLIAWLFVLYNIERLNIATPINIASFVYGLIPLMAGVLLLFPRVGERRSLPYILVLSLVIFFLLKPALGYPLLGPALPITVTEVVCLVLSLVLVDRIAYIAWDFEDAIAHLTFRQVGIPPRLYETLNAEDLYREIKRSRRFRHPLTLMLIRPDFDPRAVRMNRVLLDLQKTMASRYLQAQLARLFSEELRDCDLVTIQGDEYVIMLPEITESDAQRYATRLEQQAKEQFGVHLNIGMAGFPDKAVTLNGLVEVASRDLEANRAVVKHTLDGYSRAEGSG